MWGLFSGDDDLDAIEASDAREAEYERLVSELTPEQAMRAAQLAVMRPNASLGLVASSALVGISNDEFNRQADYDTPDTTNWRDGDDMLSRGLSAAYDGVSTVFSGIYEQVIKPVVRGVFLVGDTFAQEGMRFPGAAISAAREGTSFREEYDDWGDSAGVNLVQGLSQGEGFSGQLGTGFFVGGEAEEETQAEQQSRAMVRGETASLGRLVADPLTKWMGDSNENYAYDFVSGSIDFAGQVVLDPGVLISGGTTTIARRGGSMAARLARAGGRNADEAAQVGRKVQNIMSVPGTTARRRARESFQIDQGTAAAPKNRALAGDLVTQADEAADVGDEAMLQRVVTEMSGLVNSRAPGMRGVVRSKVDEFFKRERISEQITKMDSPTEIAAAWSSQHTLDPDMFIRLADATDEADTLRLLTEAVSEGFIKDRNFYSGMGGKWRTAMSESKFGGIAPTGFLRAGDKMMSFGKVDSMLRQVGVDDREFTDSLFRRFNDIDANDPEANTVMLNILIDAMDRVADEVAGATRMDRRSSTVKEVTSIFQDTFEGIRLYNVDAMGSEAYSPHNHVETFAAPGGGSMQIEVPGPGLFTEMSQMSVPMPDVKALRRMATESDTLRAIYTNAGWEGGTEIASKFLRGVFKPAVLLRPAYIARTLLDDHMRMASAGLDGLFQNPQQFLAAMVKNPREMTDLLGKEIGDIAQAQGVLNHTLMDELGSQPGSRVGRIFRVLRRPPNGTDPEMIPKEFLVAARRELAQLANDEIARMIYRYQGDTDKVIATLRGRSVMTPEAEAAFDARINAFGQFYDAIGDPQRVNAARIKAVRDVSAEANVTAREFWDIPDDVDLNRLREVGLFEAINEGQISADNFPLYQSWMTGDREEALQTVLDLHSSIQDSLTRGGITESDRAGLLKVRPFFEGRDQRLIDNFLEGKEWVASSDLNRLRDTFQNNMSRLEEGVEPDVVFRTFPVSESMRQVEGAPRIATRNIAEGMLEEGRLKTATYFRAGVGAATLRNLVNEFDLTGIDNPEEFIEELSEVLTDQLTIWSQGNTEAVRRGVNAQEILGRDDVVEEIKAGGMHHLRESSLLGEIVARAPRYNRMNVGDEAVSFADGPHLYRGEQWTLKRYQDLIESGVLIPGEYWDISRMSSLTDRTDNTEIFRTGALASADMRMLDPGDKVEVVFRYGGSTRAVDLTTVLQQERELLAPAQRFQIRGVREIDPWNNNFDDLDEVWHNPIENVSTQYDDNFVNDFIYNNDELPEEAVDVLSSVKFDLHETDNKAGLVHLNQLLLDMNTGKFNPWNIQSGMDLVDKAAKYSSIPVDDLDQVLRSMGAEPLDIAYWDQVANDFMNTDAMGGLSLSDNAGASRRLVIDLDPVDDEGVIGEIVSRGGSDNLRDINQSVGVDNWDTFRGHFPDDLPVADVRRLRQAHDEIQTLRDMPDDLASASEDMVAKYHPLQMNSDARALVDNAPITRDPTYMPLSVFSDTFDKGGDVTRNTAGRSLRPEAGLMVRSPVGQNPVEVQRRIWTARNTMEGIPDGDVVELPPGLRGLSADDQRVLMPTMHLRVKGVEVVNGRKVWKTEIMDQRNLKRPEIDAPDAIGSDALRRFVGGSKNPEAQALLTDDDVLRRWIESIKERQSVKTGDNDEIIGMMYGDDAKAPDAPDFFDEANNEKIEEYLRARYESLPPRVKGQIPQDTDRSTYNRVIDYLSDMIISRPSNYLSRGPAWQQSMVNNLRDLMPQMTPEVRADALKYARENLRMTQSQRMELEEVAEKWKGATGRLDDLARVNELVITHATRQVGDLLFDVQNKSAFQDAFDNFFPFVDAWRESLEVYARQSLRNPAFFLRQAARLRGLEESGFIYTNDQGERVFANPGSTLLSEFVARMSDETKGPEGNVLGVPLDVLGAAGGALGATAGGLVGGDEELGGTKMVQESRLSGTNLMFNSIGPGFGPMVQWAVGAFGPTDPQYEFLNELINPYGAAFESPRDLGDMNSYFRALAPAWAQKAANALSQGMINEVQWNSTVSDAMQYHLYQGNFDPTDPNDQNRLLEASQKTATWNLLLRGLVQATSITGPSIEVYARTPELDPDWEGVPDWDPQTDPDGTWHSMGVLADEYYNLVDLYGGDFDLAYQKFTETYGLEPAYLAQSRSMSVTNMPATAEAEWWAENNTEFFNRHPAVAGYFAPPNSSEDIDYTVYLEQISRGEREIIDPQGQLMLANATRARQMKYNIQGFLEAGGVTGNKLNEAMYYVNAEVNNRFPGWEGAASPIERQPTNVRISLLEAAVEDPAAVNTLVYEPLKKYFEARSFYLQWHAQQEGRPNVQLRSNAAQPYRQFLREYGRMLSNENAAFAGLWRGLLSREVQD